MPREPGYGSKRSQDGEAPRTCSEHRAGCPVRTSGDGAWADPSQPCGQRPATRPQGAAFNLVFASKAPYETFVAALREAAFTLRWMPGMAPESISG